MARGSGSAVRAESTATSSPIVAYLERFGYTNVSARYMGRDNNGQAMYSVSWSDRDRRYRKTQTWDGQVLGTPNMARATGGITQPGTVRPDNIRAMKDKWATWVSNMLANQSIGAETARGFLSTIRRWDGTGSELDEHFRFVEVNIPVGGRTVERVFEPDDSLFDIGFPGGGGGGGGGGFAGPQYVAPDRRVVEDYVKGVLVSLVGTVPDGQVEGLINLYMKDHRRNFDSLDQEIDPGMSVVEAVRKTGEYRRIHALRPESEDERTWIAERAAASKRGGLSADKVEDFAIEQAAVGGDPEDVEVAAGVRQFDTSDQVRGTILEQRLQETVASLFRGVVV